MRVESIGENRKMQMERRNKNINRKKGSSTLEILLAFAILILSMSAVIMVGFGNQSVSIDSETNTEAINKANASIEKARADSRENFLSVLSNSQTENSGALSYEKKLEVLDISPCKKEITGLVSWNSSSPRPQEVKVSTILTSIAQTLALGGDCDTDPVGDWDNPQSAVSVNISGQSSATDIDIQDKIVFLTTNPSSPAKDDFFIYEFDSSNLTLTELSSLDTSSGLNAVDVAGDFAYLANNETERQLMIIDISDTANPILISSSTLPQMTTGVGKSIFYHKDRVYIGTQYLACPPSCSASQNNEFHIYDVSDKINPVWLGSLNVNHNINKIVVQGDYAYLATSANDGEFMIVDVSDPANMIHSDTTGMKFDAPGNQDGTAIYILGNRAYLGLWRGNGSGNSSALSDFFVLDILNPLNISIFGSRDLGIANNAGIVGVRVRGNLAFLAINHPTFGFAILNISTSSLLDHTVCTSLNFSENTTGIDMENNFVFTANGSNAEIRVIQDQPTQCTP